MSDSGKNVETQAPRLLIIEDDWMVANGLRDMLRTAGFQVVGIASRADQVADLVREHAPTLALVDIHLGRGGDGVEIARTLLTTAGVRVIFASAHADDATLARVRAVHAHGFVVKPFSQKQLCAAIEIAIGRRPTTRPPGPAIAHLAAAQQALAGLAAAIGATGSGEEVGVRLHNDKRLAALSQREREVVRGLLEHSRVPAIATRLGISEHTVRNHLKSVFSKLHVSSQQELLDAIIDRAGTPPKPKDS